jgi:hypothetical protein
MLRASGRNSYSPQPHDPRNQPRHNDHLNSTAHARPSRDAALRPRGFSHRLRDEKSLVYFDADVDAIEAG